MFYGLNQEIISKMPLKVMNIKEQSHWFLNTDVLIKHQSFFTLFYLLRVDMTIIKKQF